MNDITFYIIGILVIIVGVILLKRFVGCAIRIIVTLILMAILAFAYYYYKYNNKFDYNM